MTDGNVTLKCAHCEFETNFKILIVDSKAISDFLGKQTCADCGKQSPLSHFFIYRICPHCNSHDEYSPYDRVCSNCNGALIDERSKPTNPKDKLGSNKIPYHLFPKTAVAHGTLAMLYGALLYGRSNFRAIGVRASIYYDACSRHLDKWFEGETYDKDSGVHHLGHALACIAIILDAEAANKLNDDRMVKGGYLELMEKLTPEVKRLKHEFDDRNPHHYTKEDNLQDD